MHKQALIIGKNQKQRQKKKQNHIYMDEYGHFLCDAHGIASGDLNTGI